MSPELLKALRLIEIKAKKAVTSALSGAYRSAFKAEGISFAEVRPYQPGDDVRRIEWKVTARLGTPYLKQFEEERELNVILAIDSSASQTFASGGPSKFKVALELSALLGFSALHHQDRVGLLRFSDRIETYVPPKKGKNHLMRLLTEMLTKPMEGPGTNIALACESLVNLSTKKAVIFLITDMQDEGYETALGILAKKHELIPIILEDPREKQWPDLGRVRLKDLETGEFVWIDMNDPMTRQSYLNMVYSKRKSDERICNSVGARPLYLDISKPYLPELLRYFEGKSR